MRKRFYIYIIYSEGNDLYYKGITTHVGHRLMEHNENRSRYTANKGPWKLVYLNEMGSKREALIEERRLKKMNRKSIEKLIAT